MRQKKRKTPHQARQWRSQRELYLDYAVSGWQGWYGASRQDVLHRGHRTGVVRCSVGGSTSKHDVRTLGMRGRETTGSSGGQCRINASRHRPRERVQHTHSTCTHTHTTCHFKSAHAESYLLEWLGREIHEREPRSGSRNHAIQDRVNAPARQPRQDADINWIPEPLSAARPRSAETTCLELTSARREVPGFWSPAC